jgi:hypothetical protein
MNNTKERSSPMTVEAVKVIITAEISGREIELARMEIGMNARIDEEIYRGMKACGQRLQKELLEEADRRLWKTVARDWENKGRKKRQIVTSTGWIEYKRRIYKDEDGEWRKPLDEMLALEPKEHYSRSVKEKAGYLVSELPYRKAAEVLEWTIGASISHTTTGSLMKRVGEAIEAEEEEKRDRVFEQGEEVEAGKTPAEVLYGESDGVYVSLQGETEKSTEVRVGVLYTGKKRIAKGRKRLENKVVVTKVVKNSQEWQETLLKAAYENYDLDTTTQMIIGGDGSAWVQQSFDMFNIPREFVLDRFHLYRDARRAFGFTAQTEAWIYKIRTEGLDAVRGDMLTAVSKASPKQAEKMQQFIQYLVNNQDGLLDPDCRTHLTDKYHRLGAIEGNVDKLVARRLKGRGRSWSLRGLKAMLAICRHQEQLRKGGFTPFKKSQAEQQKRVRRTGPDYSEWLNAKVPALHLAHKNRPWAQVLRDRIYPSGVL